MKTSLAERIRWRQQAASARFVTIDSARMNAVLDDLDKLDDEPKSGDPFCPRHGRASRPSEIPHLHCAGLKHCLETKA